MSIDDKFSLANFPNLRGYVNSIGAEQLNFRKYLIKEYVRGSYYVERAYIKINDDGDVDCPEEYRPTEHVANLIRQEIQNVRDWPKVIAFSERQIDKLKEFIGENDGIYRFYLRGSKLDKYRAKMSLDEDSTMIMLQVRYKDAAGNKAYKPWSYYSDGKWRMMEPEEKLPFFKPQFKSPAMKIMLHEGPKAALAAQQHAENYRKGEFTHPWAKELAVYEHWGIIGGALATHRSDYSELTDEKVLELIFMADNDDLGKKSVVTVSKLYGKKMSVIQFDERWKTTWDIADPMPESFFKEGGNYTGPSLNSLIHPATWATKEIPNTEGRRKLYDLTDAFLETWAFSIKPNLFINIDKPSQYYSEDEFNVTVRSCSDVKKTSELLVAKFNAKVDELMYDPSKPSGIYNVGTNRMDSRVKFNMHIAPTIPMVRGDDTIWHQYLAHMFPDADDRYQVMRWIATLICKPEIKINYAVLLISEQQGVGKSTLASYILAPLIGESNVSYPEESIIVESRFNSWQVRKRLAIVNEIYAGHSYKAYNRLKSVITEQTVTVEEKYMTNYEVENWCHVFACSNDERAIKFAIDDRRWLVPLVTEKTWGMPNWKRLHKWLKEDGLGIIKQWAYDFVDKDPANGIQHGEQAPMTRRKQAVYETMLSDGERLVLDRMAAIKDRMIDEHGGPMPFFVVIHDLRTLIKNELHPGKNDFSNVESSYRIKKLLKGNGYYVSSSRVRCPGAIMSEVVGNFGVMIQGTYTSISEQMKRVHLYSDDPREISLQNCL